MRKGWEIKTLGEVCNFVRGPFGGSLKKEDFVSAGVAVYEQQHAIYDQFDTIRYYIKESKFNEMKRFELKSGDLIMSCSGTMGKTSIVPTNIKKGIINQALLKLSPKPTIDVKFLKLWMDSPIFQVELSKHTVGAAIKNVASVKILKEISISLPKLVEQKQIVEILDKAFADLEIVRANAETNLKNAIELFECYLSNSFEYLYGTQTLSNLGTIFEVKSGGTPSRVECHYWGGEIPWYSSGELNGKATIAPKEYITELGLLNSNAKIFPKGSLLIGMYDTAALKMSILDRDGSFNQAISGVKPTNKYEMQFLRYAIDSQKKKLLEERRGVRQKNLSLEKIKSILVPVVSLDEQKSFLIMLDGLHSLTKRMEGQYSQKIELISELKQSLLAKAFSGELLKDDNVIHLNISANSNTKAPEFTANIIAYAHLAHKRKQRDKTFGHVKAQKILQLFETIGGIDLGRNPQKDAAGPNDFGHMLRAEDTARANQFFEFVQQGSGYDFAERLKYNQLIAEARKAIEPFKSQIDKVLEIIIPMDSKQAEVFATVHAAWNNLLLEGKQPNNDEIIYEARENWHDDKLKIPRSEFENAIKLIKSHGVEPKGEGKRVIGQERLI